MGATRIAGRRCTCPADRIGEAWPGGLEGLWWNLASPTSALCSGRTSLQTPPPWHVDWDKLEAPSPILPLGGDELKWYDINSETISSSHIWSAATNFPGGNGSDRGTVDNGDHNVTNDTPLGNASTSTSSSLCSCSQTPTLAESLNITEPVQSGRPKRSNYVRLNNLHLRDDTQAEASNKSN